mmetsp:Transcript_24852/g.62388  ORF Transcript_24852/g.62388 Transcript_24852/m.62388 type:complete len:139 (+) Transcript_24852:1639-2055(+)
MGWTALQKRRRRAHTHTQTRTHTHTHTHTHTRAHTYTHGKLNGLWALYREAVTRWHVRVPCTMRECGVAHSSAPRAYPRAPAAVCSVSECARRGGREQQGYSFFTLTHMQISLYRFSAAGEASESGDKPPPASKQQPL